MTHGVFRVPPPSNEPVKSYAPGSSEKASIKRRLAELDSESIEVPLVIGGREVRTGKTEAMVKPHEYRHELGRFHQGGAAEAVQAIDAAEKARPGWAAMPWEERAAIFLRAGEMLASSWRD